MSKYLFKLTNEKFEQLEDGTLKFQDRITLESANLELAEVVDMRKPLIEVFKTYNDLDAV